MSEHFEVVPEDLHTHAAHIDGFLDRFAAIQSAIDSVTQDDEAYGIICQFLPPVLASRQEDQKRLSVKAEGNFGKLADALRRTAEQYTASDEGAAERLRRIESER
ncbi:hypothetical protein GCM10009830_08820 [Glycomyces endophyticus]|uniref:ESX-1 secretion-associated protein n=1 Tax=Glycomyces endophyticus TaxID=480996 RepID=A0ABN2G532_9ACTN